MTDTRATADAILAMLPLDAAGHVTDCGYDEAESCGCYTLPVRLAAYVAAELDRAVREALERAAISMSGIGHHRDPCRLPDTECLCGVCDFRAEAANTLRAALPDDREGDE